jgi:hypothetical protein
MGVSDNDSFDIVSALAGVVRTTKISINDIIFFMIFPFCLE